jgi:peptidyl-tRNA hydrolase
MMTTIEEMSSALLDRVAATIDKAVETYKANDPAKSKSGSEAGIGRREGRRDVAAQTVSLLYGGPGTRQHGEHVMQGLGLLS